MTRLSAAAFSALASLDPARACPQGPAPRDLEARIAQIVALPRQAPPAVVRPTVAPQRVQPASRPRARYGSLAILASAALAVLATLLWVSPSAGAPTDHALGAGRAPVARHLTRARGGVARPGHGPEATRETPVPAL